MEKNMRYQIQDMRQEKDIPLQLIFVDNRLSYMLIGFTQLV